MTVVSSKEFSTNQNRYFDLAVNEEVFIKRGNNLFHLICTNAGNPSVYDEVLEPDEDLCRAISADEFKQRCLKVVDKIFDR